jgi:hypothetical protein
MSLTNYIFVNFENVQEIDLDRIANKPAIQRIFPNRIKLSPVSASASKAEVFFPTPKAHREALTIQTSQGSRNFAPPRLARQVFCYCR